MIVDFTNGQDEFELDVCKCVIFNKTMYNDWVTFGPTFSFAMYFLFQMEYKESDEEKVIYLDHDELANRLGHPLKYWKKDINFRAVFSVGYAKIRINLKNIRLWELLQLRQKKITLVDAIKVTDIHF